MFTEPRLLRDALAISDCGFQQLLDLVALPEPILTDREISDYLKPSSRFEEVRP